MYLLNTSDHTDLLFFQLSTSLLFLRRRTDDDNPIFPGVPKIYSSFLVSLSLYPKSSYTFAGKILLPRSFSVERFIFDPFSLQSLRIVGTLLCGVPRNVVCRNRTNIPKSYRIRWDSKSYTFRKVRDS